MLYIPFMALTIKASSDQDLFQWNEFIITSSSIEQCRLTAARSTFLTEPNKQELIKNNSSASVHHKDICLDYSFVRDITTEQVVLNCLDCFLLLKLPQYTLQCAHPHSTLMCQLIISEQPFWKLWLLIYLSSTCREGGAGQQLCSWLAQSVQSFKHPAGRSFK